LIFNKPMYFIPETIAEALLEYKEHFKSTPYKYVQIQSVLIRYLVPFWNQKLKAKGKKVTKKEFEASWKFLECTPIKNLENIFPSLISIFEDTKASKSTYIAASSHIRKFLKWLSERGLIGGQLGNRNFIPHPLRRQGHSAYYEIIDPKSPHLYKENKIYGLLEGDISPSLQAEIDELYRFMNALFYPGRKGKRLRETTAQSRITQLKRMLGWYKQQAGLNNEDLTHPLLVPEANCVSDLKDAKNYIDEWVCTFLTFLKEERESKSDHSCMSYLTALSSLVKYQYGKLSEDRHYNDILPLVYLRDLINNFTNKGRWIKQPVVSDDFKWIELDEIFEKIVKPLRLECEYRRDNYCLRSITAIAASFQDYILWYLPTARPPRRQQELRNLRVALSCPVKRPRGINPEQLIQPLPVMRDRKYPYLILEPDGKWYLDVPKESYKTGETYLDQKLVVPNHRFPDGRCFYDYLEAFLYGYCRNKKGDWMPYSKKVQICGDEELTPFQLRLSLIRWDGFKPTEITKNGATGNHDFFFVRSGSGSSYTCAAMSETFRIISYRLTGKHITPHFLRDIYATYFLDREYTEDRLQSLAHAMGTSVKMLRETYDCRHPKQRNRPIEEEVFGLVEVFLDESKSKMMPEATRVLSAFKQLPESERKKVLRYLQSV